MAKPSNEINKTDFRNNYNIVRILTDINDIMKQLKSFNPNNQAVAFGTKRKHKVTLEDLMDEIKSIHARLDEHDKLFKAHGWMK